MFLFGIICAYALPPLWGRTELSSFVMCTNQNIHPISPHTCLRVRITWESFRILMLRQRVRPVTLESVRGGFGPRWCCGSQVVPMGSLGGRPCRVPSAGPTLGWSAVRPGACWCAAWARNTSPNRHLHASWRTCRLLNRQNCLQKYIYYNVPGVS